MKEFDFDRMKRKRNDNKLLKALSEHKVKCKCGHVIIIIDLPYKICDWCGRKIYRSKKDEFKDKLRRLK